MRLRLLTILLLLLAGAVVNVGVAWGCALWVRPDHRSNSELREFSSPLGAPTWMGTIWSRRGACRIAAGRVGLTPSERLPLGVSVPAWSRASRPAGPGDDGVIEDARGWPMLTMRCTYEVSGSPPQQLTLRYGLALAPNPHPVGGLLLRALPLVPIWPSFAANTLLYATIIALLFFAPFTLRRHLRACRARCPACAYPVGEAAVCSECGRAVARRRGVARS